LADRFTTQATQQTNPIFAQSQQIIQPNVSATQKLFSNLVAGLADTAGQSTQAITADAYNRGVGRASLAQDVATGFDPTLQQAGASLGADQAAQLGDLKLAQGQLGVGKVDAITQLSNSLQTGDIANRQFAQDKLAQDRAQALAIQQAEQQAARAAASRGGGGGGGPSDEATADDIQGWFNTMRGGDGNVSPDTYGQGLKAWIDAGGDEAAFHNKFQAFVNLSHSDDYYRAAQKKAEAQAYNQGRNIQTGRF
jgi:hypothetical protein